jgi:Tol biopolymer transport system component
MNEAKLRALLREEPIPGAAEAERRGLELTERSYVERRPVQPPVLPRLAIALAVAALLAALVLSPAGAAVRDWVGDVFTAGLKNAEPALTDVPGGGDLLIQSPRGPWVVHPDGSRRLLGDYDEATWSPHGLYVAAAHERSLSAIEPDGTPHWSITAPGRISEPRWSPSGFRIAYRAGRSLRVERADGSGGALVAAASAAVAPTWYPPGPHLLAYVDARRRLVLAEADTGKRIAATAASPGVTSLSWSHDGRELLEIARGGLWLREVRPGKLAFDLADTAHRVELPAGAVVRAASFAPQRRTIAVLLERRSAAGPRSEVLLLSPAGGSPRRLFAVSGRLTELAWSPDGRRLLLAWPAADQWLFVPVRRGPRLRAIGDISGVFSPGHVDRAAFPRVEGWCCQPPKPGA